MRILYICKSLPHRYQGGIQTHTSELAEHLTQRGHDISVLTAGSIRKGVQCYEMKGFMVIEAPYLPMRRFPFLPILLEELSFNVSAWLWLKKNQFKYDIVHLQGRSGFLFPKKHNETTVFTTFHGLIHLENKFSKQILNLDRRIHQRVASYFEKNAFKNSNAVISVSHEMQRELNQLNIQIEEKPRLIIPNGVAVKKSHNGGNTDIKSDNNTIIFVGRLDRIKGIFQLVKAMKKVDKNVKLVMLGDGMNRTELEEFIRTEGVSDRVELMGAQSNDNVLNWIKRGFALVLPSFHETQGIVLLEANTCGKAVAASNVGGVPEVVTHGYNGLLFNPYNIQEIADAINQLYRNPEMTKQMGENGRKLVAEKFNWSKIAADTEGVYKQVLASKKCKDELKLEVAL